jgi:hypothetical protein
MRGGYAQGETKRLIIEAQFFGLTIFDVIKRSGKSYASIYNACYRSGIKLPSKKKRCDYGYMKSIIYNASESGMTESEICSKYGLKKHSVKRSASHYGVCLKSK